MNLGTDEDRKEVKMGAKLSSIESKELHELLKEYVDVFVWSYVDMPGLSMDIVMHEIHTKSECKPVK